MSKQTMIRLLWFNHSTTMVHLQSWLYHHGAYCPRTLTVVKWEVTGSIEKHRYHRYIIKLFTRPIKQFLYFK